MKYKNTSEAVFLRRPNRFVAYCNIDGKEKKVYVPNTGRCAELFVKGAKAIVSKAAPGEKRKTEYTLVSVYKGDRLVNIDSQAPNRIVYEGLSDGKILPKYRFTDIQREKTYRNSRFDIFYEREENGEKIKGFIEVKGVTLENDNICRFPDAPTERGLKHIKELMAAKDDSFEANIIFLIQIDDVDLFLPNADTQMEFARTLALSQEKGVNIYAFSCNVTPEEVTVDKEVKIGDLKQFL